MSQSGLNDRVSEAAARDVSRETLEKLQKYASLLQTESKRQNLVSASTLEDLWERHVVDSAQLVRFEPQRGASWLDIGSGAGLPGVVIACIVEGPVTLIEPRRLRADFLRKAVAELGLAADVVTAKAETASGRFDIITARAVAPLTKLLQFSHHLSTRNTVWALPKGRSAHSELADAKRSWQGTFHVERSLTSDDSFIIVGTGVRAKRR